MRAGAEYEIHIEQLRVGAHIGVSKGERAKRQRLVLNITAWPVRDFPDIKDAISRTVDYAVLCRETKTYLTRHSSKLLETLAQDLTAHLLRKFHIQKIHLEVRKFV